MSQSNRPSLIGGACIIASVCIGAGMLGLPTAGAGGWTLWSILAMTVTMLMMTLSGSMLLEAFKPYPLTVSFHSLVKDVLGNHINRINNLAVYFVGFLLLYAYTTSAGNILSDLLQLSTPFTSVLFVLFFSAFVWRSTHMVDRISIVLVVFMLISFILGVSGLTSQIDVNLLFNPHEGLLDRAPYVLALFPVALTSFGYHHSVSSMRAYYQEEKRTQYAILGGCSIALGFYIVWLISIYGHIPRADFAPIIASGGDVDLLLKTIGASIQFDQVQTALRVFSIAAIFSSFVGVGLGMFDFLADCFHLHDKSHGRGKTWFITFIPPLVMSLLSPLGFISAIGYAGAAATLWTCIIPALLIYKVRYQQQHTQGYRAPAGKFAIIAVFSFGVLTCLFHILAMLHWLPTY